MDKYLVEEYLKQEFLNKSGMRKIQNESRIAIRGPLIRTLTIFCRLNNFVYMTKIYVFWPADVKLSQKDLRNKQGYT